MIGEFSKYKVIEKLGAGGMGEVYKAEDLALLRTVAIKVISKQDRRMPDAEIRFLREARSASAINHPNIVTIYETGETDQYSYIVMEYVKGRSLRDLIDGGALTPEVIIDISLQIADALAEAHSHRIIHRDIKPENILVTERGLVKVLDFGLAKLVPSIPDDPAGPTYVQSLTESGAILGTLSYMSPEQLRGEPLDDRTDIFSFGIVLYKMITGRLPFTGGNSFEIAAAILKEQAIKIDRVPAGLPRGIIPVVMRCLEKSRESRYRSFADIKRQLAGLKHEPSRATDVLEQTVEMARHSSGTPDSFRPASGSKFAPRMASTPTILVLPLEVVGSGEELMFIGVGLAHAIMTNLAKISGLAVLSKSAGGGRASQKSGAHALARELGASLLLEGEVMRAGQMIGVMARLTDAESGRVLWGEQFRGDSSDLFSVHDSVCEGVAAALKVNISSDIRQQIARPATNNIEAFELYSKGRAYVERYDVKTNVDHAIQMFEEAIKLDQDFVLAYAGLGEAYWRKYQASHDDIWVERAVAVCDHALVLDPYQAQVHISLGIIYYGTGKTDGAIKEFERTIEIQPLNAEAQRRLGLCYQRKGEVEQAIDYFNKAIHIRPGAWDYYNDLGICYYTFGRYRDAAEQFRRVITIQPDNYNGYNNLGGMYYLLGLYEDAVTMHRRAIEIHPNEDAYSNLGTDYFYLGRYDEAIAAYKTAIELDPGNDFLYFNMGDAYLRVGRNHEAEQQFERASQLISKYMSVREGDAELIGRFAICQAKLGREQEALSSIERAIALEPRNTTVMYQKAIVFALTGHNDEAISSLENALSHGYSRSEAERDPNLDALRNIEKYRSLFVIPL